MSNRILIWWVILCSVACVNIGMWTYTASWLSRRKHQYHPVDYKHRQWLLWLSSVYVFVCAFRSFFPRVDVLRICLVDTPLSSIFLGRSLATIAEICFIVELCLLFYFVGKRLHVRYSLNLAIVIILLVVIAEGFSWYAVLTTDNEGHVIENSIWTLAGILMVAFLSIIQSRARKGMQALLARIMAFGIGYVAYMVLVNVPMYVSRWQDDVIQGKEYLDLRQGLQEILHHCTVTFYWNLWRDDLGWQTLYFSAAVWLSIALIYIRPFGENQYESGQ